MYGRISNMAPVYCDFEYKLKIFNMYRSDTIAILFKIIITTNLYITYNIYYIFMLNISLSCTLV